MTGRRLLPQAKLRNYNTDWASVPGGKSELRHPAQDRGEFSGWF
jgi:hypothetical protein